jgi:hypothetical protein
MFVVYFPLVNENRGDYTTGGGVYRVRVIVNVPEASLKIIKELLTNELYLILFDKAVKYTESESLLQYFLVIAKFPIIRLPSVYAFIGACAELQPLIKLIVLPFILTKAFGLAFKLVENRPSKLELILAGGVITT